MKPEDIPNFEELSAVTEQGMFGELNLRDPNVRKVSEKDKKKDDKSKNADG